MYFPAQTCDHHPYFRKTFKLSTVCWLERKSELQTRFSLQHIWLVFPSLPSFFPPFISPSRRPRPLAPPGPWAAAAAFSSPSSSSCPQVSSGDARGRGTRRDTALLALVMRGALRGSVGSSPPGRGSRGRPARVQPGATRVRGYPRRRAPGASLALVKLWGQPGQRESAWRGSDPRAGTNASGEGAFSAELRAARRHRAVPGLVRRGSAQPFGDQTVRSGSAGPGTSPAARPPCARWQR